MALLHEAAGQEDFLVRKAGPYSPDGLNPVQVFLHDDIHDDDVKGSVGTFMLVYKRQGFGSRTGGRHIKSVALKDTGRHEKLRGFVVHHQDSLTGPLGRQGCDGDVLGGWGLWVTRSRK